jgi:hypothetical protein
MSSGSYSSGLFITTNPAKIKMKVMNTEEKQMKIIAKISKETGLSQALLFYAAKFGIIGLFTRK